MKAQGIKPDRVLGVVVPPFVVRQFAQGLQRVIVLPGEAPIDNVLRNPRRLGGAEVGGLEDGAHHPPGRDRVLLDVFPVAAEHAAEILRPRAIHRRVQNHVPGMTGAQFLGLGREPEEGIDLALREQVERLDLGIDHPLKVLFGVEPDLGCHQL